MRRVTAAILVSISLVATLDAALPLAQAEEQPAATRSAQTGPGRAIEAAKEAKSAVESNAEETYAQEEEIETEEGEDTEYEPPADDEE